MPQDNAISRLSRAEALRTAFDKAICAAVSELTVGLIAQCDADASEIDTKAFHDSVSDGTADMLADMFKRLQNDAEEEGDADYYRDLRSDRAAYHAAVL